MFVTVTLGKKRRIKVGTAIEYLTKTIFCLYCYVILFFFHADRLSRKKTKRAKDSFVFSLNQ